MGISHKNILIASILLAFAAVSLAQVETARIKNLARKADVIVTAKVAKKESAWNESKTRIYTRTTLQVDEYLKGDNSKSSLEVTYLGGEVGGVGEIYTHMPKFETDEDVLLFLREDKKSKQLQVLDGEEGKISFIRDTKTREKVTRSNIKMNDLKSQIRAALSTQK